MPNLGIGGIDVRQPGDAVVIRALLQDATGDLVVSGSTVVRLYELQDDATVASLDFADGVFKTTALTQETTAMTHRRGNAGNTNTGIWTVALTNLAGFTPGAVYFAEVISDTAFPPVQGREFQFGGVEGDPGAKVWTYPGRSLTEAVEAVLGPNGFDGIIIASGLTGRVTTVSGAAVEELNARQAMSILLAALGGDRKGVDTREIAASLPGELAKLTADRVSRSEIQSTIVVPD